VFHQRVGLFEGQRFGGASGLTGRGLAQQHVNDYAPAA
jgi:hypothetical protein